MDVGVWSVLVFREESAAHDAARDLAASGCRVVAVRPATGNGMYDVSALTVYGAPEGRPEPLELFLHQEKRRVAALSRARGGALLTYVYSSGGGVPAHSRAGLVHEDGTACVAVPDPLPVPRPSRSGPPWEGLDFGEPRTEVGEAVAVARRMYGGPGAVAPQLVEFLMDDGFLDEIEGPGEIGEPAEDMREFVADLRLAAHHMPTRDAGRVLIVPYLAELARSHVLSPGARTSVLRLLLGFASELDAGIAGSADWEAMGGRSELRYPTLLRGAVAEQVPRLVPLWEREGGAARYVLAALATFAPALTASRVRPRLPAIPVLQGTDRADALALADALLAEDTDALDVALRQVATWDRTLAERLDSPHTPHVEAARASLAAYVERDLSTAVRLG